MASPNSWPNGLAGTGPTLAEVTNDYFSGSVFWVDTVLGLDANSGLEREMPKKTLLSAHTAAVAGDLIVIEAGSAETIAVSYALSKAGVTILGLGTGDNRPRYTVSGAVDLFAITAAGVRMFNIYFPASTALCLSRIRTTAAETEVNGCYFEHGAMDTAPGIVVGAAAHNCRLIDDTHAVTASRPAMAVSVIGGVTDLYVENVQLLGGSYGWTDYAFKISTAASTRIYVNGMTLAGHSDFGVTITGCTYKIFGVDTSGSGRVVIAS